MRVEVALLTGGGDRPYALGLAAALLTEGIAFDFIGSDFLEAPDLCRTGGMRFLNLRGDMAPDAPPLSKGVRVLRYYCRLLRYVISAEPSVFHILWNNKIEIFDRTLLLLYYRLMGKRLVITVHNVNAGKRDGNDSAFNRLTLKIQYHLADHLFVHTEKMRQELRSDFGVPTEKISVIPFGINSTVPDTSLTSGEARRRLGIDERHKTVLFYGNIAPYKGLEYLVDAFSLVKDTLPECILIIAGRPKGAERYWDKVQLQIRARGLSDGIIERIEFVPDADTEVFFKAADVLALPYTHVFQSGVLFLGYNFGLPVIATDVGSLRNDIIEGETGFVCESKNSVALADAIQRYFASELFHTLASRRQLIRSYANEHHSWRNVAAITKQVYRTLAT